MASASAVAGELAVQLPAPASSLDVPPPAASTAEAVILSAGVAIVEDPGQASADFAGAAASTRAGFLPDSRCLFRLIYSRLCSGRGGTIISTCRRWLRWCLCLFVFVTCFHFITFACGLLFLPFSFLVILHRYFVCTYTCMGSDTAMYEVLLFLLMYPAYERVAYFVSWN